MTEASDAFTLVFQRHYRHVLAYALRRVDDASAHDVVAETFLAAWRHIDRLPDEPLPWLYRTAAHCIANQARSSRRQVRLAVRLALDETVARDHAEGVVESNRLTRALTALNDLDREALLLVAWEGLDHRAVAYALGCSVTALRVRLHRARKRLRALLREAEPLDAAFSCANAVMKGV
jgi:RNA polymerase sigma-70 factor (ECF subfamily)